MDPLPLLCPHVVAAAATAAGTVGAHTPVPIPVQERVGRPAVPSGVGNLVQVELASVGGDARWQRRKNGAELEGRGGTHRGGRGPEVSVGRRNAAGCREAGKGQEGEGKGARDGDARRARLVQSLERTGAAEGQENCSG